MLSNAYFPAKFRFDTAENEPAKNWQKFAKILQNFANFAKFASVAGPLQALATWGAYQFGDGGISTSSPIRALAERLRVHSRS